VSPEVSVESTGETVGEAKWKALRDLERVVPGVDKANVRFQVVSEGERGLLGVGYTPARVIAAADAPEAPEQVEPDAELSEVGLRVRSLVEQVVAAIGTGSRVGVRETDDEITVACVGGDPGLLIGKHGQTIDALQYVANAAAHRRGIGKSVTVDVEGYRERRRATLEGIAMRAADQAVSGDRVLLEPMTAVERKVVHTRLQDVPGVQTTSEGTEPNRYVVVLPE
jgi:spoIIIJ-associated protein